MSTTSFGKIALSNLVVQRTVVSSAQRLNILFLFAIVVVLTLLSVLYRMACLSTSAGVDKHLIYFPVAPKGCNLFGGVMIVVFDIEVCSSFD